MRQGLLRNAAVAAVALVASTGCTGTTAPSPRDPASPSPSAGSGATFGTGLGHPGSDGLIVRHLDRSGGISTLRVEDFPH